MLGLKLNHVSKRGYRSSPCSICCKLTETSIDPHTYFRQHNFISKNHAGMQFGRLRYWHIHKHLQRAPTHRLHAGKTNCNAKPKLSGMNIWIIFQFEIHTTGNVEIQENWKYKQLWIFLLVVVKLLHFWHQRFDCFIKFCIVCESIRGEIATW